MTYKLVITSHVNDLIDQALRYLIFSLNNPSAASAVMQDIETACERLRIDPFAFSMCEDIYLRKKEYRKLKLQKHDYVIIFKIIGDEVIVYGFFHTRENYGRKL